MTVVGVDLGGTNLRVAAVEDGAIVRRQRVVLGEARGVDAVVAAIAELVAEVAGAAAVVPVGVGVAAMLADRRGTVVNAPNLGWRDVGFGAALAARLGAH